jgi:uncharacterized MAPEG superfamily protein
MTLALWCLLVASLLPIACAGIAKWGFRGFDNNNPREWLARQQGWRARAHAAQQNSWEALAIFTAAVLTAHLVDASQATVDGLAVGFIVARFAYVACYLADWATLRSLVWLAGLGLSIALFVIGA